MINKYRKKPVVIEAIQFRDTSKVISEITNFVGSMVRVNYKMDIPVMTITTLEGAMSARLGDYIVKGSDGKFTTCPSNTFNNEYSLVDDAIGMVKPVDFGGMVTLRCCDIHSEPMHSPVTLTDEHMHPIAEMIKSVMADRNHL